MKTKKTPVKGVQGLEKSFRAPLRPPAKPNVLQGDVFATFLAEAQSIGNEVAARRALQSDVDAYLAEKGLSSDFQAWMSAKNPST